jgi:prepilin signal peptidase PulO-like enzyme (type II secretory pathway)
VIALGALLPVVVERALQSHLLLLVLFAFFVSLVFAVLSKDDVREQVRFGGMLFAGFVVSAIVLGWLMLPLPF